MVHPSSLSLTKTMVTENVYCTVLYSTVHCTEQCMLQYFTLYCQVISGIEMFS